MARIELRDAIIRLKDGFAGTALVDDSSIANGNTTLEIDTVAGLTNNTSIVPTGARFVIDGVDETYVVTAANSNKVFTYVFTADEGTFTLTFNGEEADPLDYDSTAQEVEDEINDTLGADVVSVTGTAGNYRIECIGTQANLSTPTLSSVDDLELSSSPVAPTQVTVQPGAVTWLLTFTPPLVGADLPADDDEITFQSQQLEIKIGDGELKYTENTEYLYDLDRGNLDTVREGNEVPMDVSLAFVYEHITTGTDELIAPMDALKRINGASGWVSSASDQCEPYAVDVEIEHEPPCGNSQTEITTFPDFRADKKEVSLKDALITITGRCNTTQPTVTRV